MAYARINNGQTFLNRLGNSVTEGSFYLVDQIDDLLDLKYNEKTCPVGSIALVLGYKEGNDYEGHPEINLGGAEHASETFILSKGGKWVKFTGAANIMA